MRDYVILQKQHDRRTISKTNRNIQTTANANVGWYDITLLDYMQDCNIESGDNDGPASTPMQHNIIDTTKLENILNILEVWKKKKHRQEKYNSKTNLVGLYAGEVGEYAGLRRETRDNKIIHRNYEKENDYQNNSQPRNFSVPCWTVCRRRRRIRGTVECKYIMQDTIIR